MLHRLLFAFAILMAPFLCAYDSYAADADNSGLVLAEELGRAKSLIKNGNAEEAWNILRGLLREDPDNIDLNIQLTQAAFATGRDNQALAALERLVDLNPQNASLHLALAKAYARAGDQAAVGVALDEALRLDPAVVAADEQNDLEKAAKAASKRFDRFMAAGRLALGVIWDSNATCGVDSLDMDIGDYTFHLHEDAEKKAAFGEYLNGNINWSWRLGRESNWHLAGDLAVYGKVYNRELPSNRTFAWGRASIGLREISGKHMLDLRAVVNNASYEPYESATGIGGELTWLYQLLPGFDFMFRGGIESRTYMEYDGKDGLYWNAGIYGRYNLGESKHTVLAGVKAIGSQTKHERYSYEGFEAMLRLDLALFGKLTVSPFGAWRYAAYHGAATALSGAYGEGDRADSMILAGLGLAWNWTESLATEIGWQYIKNFSTSPLYRYDQHQINMGMVFSF